MAVPGPVGRCLAVLALLTAAATALLALVLPTALAPADPASFVELLVRTCAAAASVGVVWLWLGAAAVGVSLLCRTPAPAVPGVPAAVRRLVLAGCGAALAAAPGLPALATGTVPNLPVPDRAVGTLARDTADHAADHAADRPGAAVGPGSHACGGPGRAGRSGRAATVTVTPGDSLWTIAGRALGGTASDRAVDAHWRALYARNSAVVGADPDLVLPGQRLHLPAPATATDPVH